MNTNTLHIVPPIGVYSLVLYKKKTKQELNALTFKKIIKVQSFKLEINK